jgi:exocyst complex component 3
LQLQEVIQNGLEGNEYVSILAWIMNTYAGPELMQHPELNIDISSIGPLLNSVEVDKLQQQYLKVLTHSSITVLCRSQSSIHLAL